MSPTIKTVVCAALAAAIMATVESLAGGHEDPHTIAMHAGTAALMVIAAYLKQSPITPRGKREVEGGR